MQTDMTGGVTLVSAVRLRAGAEAAHRDLHDLAVAHARRLGGLVRDELVPAIPGVQPETVALLTFRDRPALDRWLGAEERTAALDAMADLVDGERTLTVVGGYAGWFSGAETQPPRWKQAVAVMVGLVPVSLLVTLAREQLLPALPLAGAVTITSLSNVVALTWFVMPLLTQALRPWLTR
jgi:antibiotic biosynthesis monooxygenase (ABM) superfamily enzyme